MAYCCVPLCKSNRNKSKGEGTAFHEFPTDLKRRVTWLENMPIRDGEKDAEPWVPNDRSVICSKHFLPADYKIGLKKPRLLPYAIPSVFPDHPNPVKTRVVLPVQAVTNFALTLDVTADRRDETCAPVLKPKPILSRKAVISHPIAVAQDAANDVLVEEVGVVTLTKDKGTVTKLTMGDLCSKARKYRSARQSLKYLRGKMASMNSASLERVNKTLRLKLAKYSIEELESARECGDKKAMFLLEQLVSYACKKKKRWSENTMQCCGAWHDKFPTSYCFMQTLNILMLPSRSALKRHVRSGLGAPETSGTT